MAKEQGVATVPEVEEVAAAETLRDGEQLATGLRHLRDLLEKERIEEAREYVKDLARRWPEAERVQHYVHVLAPPVARRRPDIPPRPHDREHAWLRKHAHEYPGCWLAVFQDRLIAADPNLSVVLAKTREALGHEDVLLVQQSESSHSP